jgi:hypothetical protein
VGTHKHSWAERGENKSKMLAPPHAFTVGFSCTEPYCHVSRNYLKIENSENATLLFLYSSVRFELFQKINVIFALFRNCENQTGFVLTLFFMCCGCCGLTHFYANRSKFTCICAQGLNSTHRDILYIIYNFIYRYILI